MVGRPRGWKEALLGVRSPLPADATARERAEHFMGFENTRRLGAVTGGAGTQGNARYPAEPLEAELRSQFGDTLMSQALRPVAVVSCDLDRADPLIFVGGGIGRGDLGDTYMRHVARATSAGPTFFPPLQYTDAAKVTHQCVDGGLVANDPVMLAYGIARHLAAGRDEDTMVLVSLGTGEPADAQSPEGDVVPSSCRRQGGGV